MILKQTSFRLPVLTLLALCGFAANSLLCRQALKHTNIDPASFTFLRLASGAVALWLIARVRTGTSTISGNWMSALALFLYAIAFSFAYQSLSAATGALLLFGAVQCTIIGNGIRQGDKPGGQAIWGILIAAAGLVVLLLPGLAAPEPWAAASMMMAGIAWGVYTIRGKLAGDPLIVTAGNFVRTIPFAVVPILFATKLTRTNFQGYLYAIVSGAVTSGMVYSIWYAIVPQINASVTATLQLLVPVITAIGGFVFLGEPPSWQYVLSSGAILGGVLLVIFAPKNNLE